MTARLRSKRWVLELVRMDVLALRPKIMVQALVSTKASSYRHGFIRNRALLMEWLLRQGGATLTVLLAWHKVLLDLFLPTLFHFHLWLVFMPALGLPKWLLHKRSLLFHFLLHRFPWLPPSWFPLPLPATASHCGLGT